MHAVLLVNMLNLAISKILDMNVKVKGLFSCSTFNFSLSMLSSLLKIGRTNYGIFNIRFQGPLMKISNYLHCLCLKRK